MLSTDYTEYVGGGIIREAGELRHDGSSGRVSIRRESRRSGARVWCAARESVHLLIPTMEDGMRMFQVIFEKRGSDMRLP